MLRAVLAVAVPLLVFLTMVVVGLQLTAPDFRRALRQPLLLTFAALGQLLLLPLLALGLVRILEVPSDVEAGILLVAVCPSGTAAGFYAYLARANAALAVALTALSCFTAVAALPLWMTAFRASHNAPAAFDVPVPVLAGGAAAADRFALALALVVRNLGVATAVAVTVLNRTEFAVFAAAYFVAQVPLVVAAAAWFRFRTAPAPGAVVEGGHP